MSSSSSERFLFSTESVVKDILDDVKKTSLPDFITDYLPKGSEQAASKVEEVIRKCHHFEFDTVLIDAITKEGHFSHESVAYLLHTKHPLLDSKNEGEKRMLLDRALCLDASNSLEGVEDHIRRQTYQGYGYIQSEVDRLKGRSTRSRSLVTKLRSLRVVSSQGNA